MKKSIALLLATALLLSLTGCGSSGSSQGNNTNTQPNTENNTQNKSDDTAVKEENTEEQKENTSEKPKAVEYIINNEVVVDNEYCTVTIVDATAKNSGVDFKINLENKTTDKNIMFSIDNTAVNGWIIPSLFATSVAAGKKSNDTLSFSKSDLENCGLTTVDKLELGLRVYDNDDWVADAFVDDTFTVYPTGLSEADVVSPERWAGNDEMIVVDDENCSFIILGTYNDKIWGYTVNVYLENKTSNTSMMFSWENVSVNGYMIDPFWATTVSPGNKKLTTITFGDTQFKENGIESVEEIEFGLRVYDEDNWTGSDFVNSVFTYKPTK